VEGHEMPIVRYGKCQQVDVGNLPGRVNMPRIDPRVVQDRYVVIPELMTAGSLKCPQTLDESCSGYRFALGSSDVCCTQIAVLCERAARPRARAVVREPVVGDVVMDMLRIEQGH